MNSRRNLFTCPSAQPDQPEAVILGVVRDEVGAARVETLSLTLPLHPLIDLIPGNVRPTEVLRFSAPCAGQSCAHFADGNCELARRVVSLLPPVTERLRSCAIRPTCRWWKQEGVAACLRCPQVITEPYSATDLMREVAQAASRGVNSHGETS